MTPLTPTQHYYWQLQANQPNLFLYHVSHALRLEGELDSNDLQQTLATVWQASPHLQAAVVANEPLTIVEGHYTQLPFTTHLATNEAAVEEVLQEMVQRPFNLTTDPLIRFQLVTVADHTHYLLIVAHRLLASQAQLHTLGQRVAHQYAGQPYEAPTDSISPASAEEDSTLYWEMVLESHPQLLELPLDYVRPAMQSGRGGMIPFDVDPATVAHMQTVADTYNITLSDCALALLGILLHRYTGQTDLMLGEHVVTMQQETYLPLRLHIDGEDSFRQQARAIQATRFEAYRHRHVPFAAMVAQSASALERSHAPIFQNQFSWQTVSAVVRGRGLSWHLVPLFDGIAPLDLSLTMWLNADGACSGQLVYQQELFDESTMQRLVGHLKTLWQSVQLESKTEAGTAVSHLPLLTSAELNQFDRWNETALPLDEQATIHSLFEAQVAREGAQTAVIHQTNQLTYAQLNQQANQLARHLQSLGVQQGDLVAVCMSRSHHLLLALLAVFKAGATYVPLDPDYPPERIQFMMNDSQARVLVTQTSLLERLPEHQATVLTLDTAWPTIHTYADHNLSLVIPPSQLAYIIYTSGSTGKPKGVAIAHQNGVAMIGWAQNRYTLDEVAGVLWSTSVCFDLSIYEMFVPLSMGGTVIVVRNALELVDGTLPDHPLTLINTVPSAMTALVRAGAVPESVRVVNLAGEPLKDSLVQAIYALPHIDKVYDLYGPSEDTTYSTELLMERGVNKEPSVGRPIANTQAYILDANQQRLPVGIVGELYLGGAGVAQGYLGRSEQTAVKFIPDPFRQQGRLYRTGDLARFRPNGEIDFLGRGDSQVKVRGYRIELGEIETRLNQHEAVDNAVVLALPDALDTLQLVAYIVLHDSNLTSAPSALSALEDGLRDFLQLSLPDYMTPSMFLFLPAFPLTPNGKINRRALPAPDFTSQHTPTEPPQTATEKQLARWWQELLGVERNGRYDHFFHLGGHSLLATQLMTRIREEFGVSIRLAEIFDAPLLHELAHLVDQKQMQEAQAFARTVERVPNKPAQMPASSVQRRMWIVEKMGGDGGLSRNYIPLGLKLSGELHIGHLVQAIQHLIAHQESLRTSFHEIDGQLYQEVHPPFTLPVPLISLETEADPLAKAWALMEKDLTTNFDITELPLLRAMVLRLAEHEHILYLTQHHIISDGWSVQLFFDQLLKIYNQLQAGQPVQLLPLPVQYRDYTLWQESDPFTALTALQQAYWLEQLAGDLPILELPLDKRRPQTFAFEGKKQLYHLPASVVAGLQAMADKTGVSLSMVVLALYNLLLFRYTGVTDLLVGSDIANRTQPEVERVMGLFLNTVVIRSDMSQNPTFEQLLHQVRQTVLEAFEHQELPYSELFELLQPERDMSRNPIYQAYFSMQNYPSATLQAEGLTITQLHEDHFETGVAHLDLSLRVFPEAEGGLLCVFEYDTRLFEERSIKQLVHHFANLATAVPQNPHQRLTHYPILSADERTRMLHSWNQTHQPYNGNRTIPDRMEELAQQKPDAVALVEGERQWTFAQFNERANQLAHYLQAQGIGQDDIVGLYMPRSTAMNLAMLATLKAGAIYMPLDPTHPDARIAYMLDDAGAKAVIMKQGAEKDIENLPAQRLLIGADGLVDERPFTTPTTPPPRYTQPDSVLCLIYTSGSTGKPKGVMNTHRNVFHLTADFFFDETFRTAHISNTAFDAATMEIWGTLLNGGRLVVIPHEVSLSNDQLSEVIVHEGINYAVMTTSRLNQLVYQIPDILNRFNYIYFGGEGADLPICQYAKEAIPHPNFINVYGPTEATVVSSIFSLNDLQSYDLAVPIGRPLPNTQLYVLDKQAQPVPVGVTGELCIGGNEGLSLGYFRRPSLTADRFIPDPFSNDVGARLYCTGDLVRYRSDGNIEFMGRADHQVKLRGFRIELSEISYVLAQYPDVQDTHVMLREDVPGLPFVAAYVTSTRELDGEEMRPFLQERLPSIMVPTTITVLPAFPLTPNGKINVRGLPVPELTAVSGTITPPSTPTEITLANWWQEAFGLEEVDIHADFFAMGGHSLLAIKLIAQIKKEFALTMPMSEFFAHPTIAEQARFIDQHQETTERLPALTPVAHENNTTPLTSIQQRIWFLYQLDPLAPTYNVSCHIQLQGNLNQTALQQSITELVNRHAVLRTTYHVNAEGQPFARIHPTASPAMTVHNLSDNPQALAQQVNKVTQAPIDLKNGPVLYVDLIHLPDEVYHLILTTHHIAIDGGSLPIVMNELSTLYTQLVAGRPTDLPPLPVQYADYAVREQAWMQGEVLEAELAYWQEKLSGELPVLNLPTDYPRPPVQTYTGETRQRPLPSDLARAIQTTSQEEGVTLFVLLFTAFNVLLGRYSRQDDLLVGIPVANRTQPELAQLIGFFVNTLVLRTNLADNPSFRDLLGQVRQTLLSAFDHKEVPFEKLVERVQTERDMSRSPLFQTMFTLEDGDQMQFERGGLHWQTVPVEADVSKFDLTLTVQHSTDEMQLFVEYNTDLFKPETIDKLMVHFEQLLQTFTAHPHHPVLSASMLTSAERQQLQAWRNPIAPPMQNAHLTALFEETAVTQPHQTALIYQTDQLTYQQLNQKANQLAHHLRGLGVGAESLVSVCMERTPNLLISLLAVLKTGAAYVPIDPNYPADRIEFMMTDAQTAVLLTQADLQEKLPSHPQTILLDSQWQEQIAPHAIDNPPPTATGDNLAYIIYTSGSTGKPKGVAMTHGNALAMVTWAQTVYQVDTLAGVLMATSVCFDLSIYEIFLTLSSGGTLILAENALQLPQLPAREQVTLINTVPSAIGGLLAMGDLPANVRIVNLAGEPLHRSLVNQIYAQPQVESVYNLYGPSEDTTYSTFTLVPHVKDEPPTIGRAIDHTQSFVVDGLMQETPLGVPGELLLSGAGVARGYLQRPSVTAEKFIPNPFSDQAGARLYRTGDLARVLPDGELAFMGRIDYQVKFRGFRIELGEIEAVLARHEAVGETAVLLREDSPNQKMLVGYVTAEASTTASDLREFLSQTLPDYMIPAPILILPEMPHLPNGKINRRALPIPDATASDQPFVPATTPIQELLVSIWEALLLTKPIGMTQDFFDLGGHSLLATQLLAQVETQLKVTIPLGTFFERSTIADLADFIETARKTEQNLLVAPIEAQTHHGTAPLSSAQKRMWVLYRMAPQAFTYNVPFVLRMDGNLHVSALETALNQILHRHTVLRTTYEIKDGEPLSVIHPPAHLPLSLYDVSHLPEDEREPTARQYVMRRAIKPFDLTNGPMFHMELVRLQADQHILLLATHHIAMDGWSVNVFAQEMATLYRATLADAPMPLPPLPVQYADYAVWQQNWIKSDRFQTQLAYWAERLTPLRDLTPFLPTDRPMPRDLSQQNQGGVYRWRWEEALSQHVEAFAREMGCTPYMVMLAGFQLLLHRYSGQQHISVGSPIANRSRPEITNLLGFFVNTLVLATDFGAVKTFRDLLQMVRSETLGAFDRQDMPFDELVKAFPQKGRTANAQPFFRALFNFQKGGDEEQQAFAMPDLDVSFVELDGWTAKFDLLFESGVQNGQFGGNFGYRKALFDEDTIITMMAHLKRTITQAMADPDRPVHAYTVWSDEVQERWRQTAVTLQSHPAIQTANVQAWQDVPTKRGETAYLVLAQGASQPSDRDLRQLLSEKQIPSPINFVFVNSLEGVLPMPPSMDDEQPQEAQTKAQTESAKAKLAAKKAGLSDKKRALLEKMLAKKAKAKAKQKPKIEPRPDDGTPIPLSFAQERLWFLQQLAPSAAYNMPFRFDLPFAVDKQVLEKSIRTILERHAVLRTTFAWDGENPTQQINPVPAQILPEIDLSQEADPEQAWHELSSAEAQRPFDLATDHPFRTQLVKMGADHYRLVLNMHHIAFDGWSWGIFMREFTQLYMAYSQNRLSPLPPLPIQYADFAVWQRQPEQQEKFTAQIEYWKQQLADVPEALELPTDYQRPAVPTYQGGMVERNFPPELSAEIKALMQAENVTPFMLYLAMFSALLYRYTQQEDIVIGTPVANRLMREIEPLVGFFVNTLALRLQITPQTTIRDLLKQARQVMLDAQSNQDVPFETIVQAVQPNRELSRQPLFQVMLLAQGEDGSEDDTPSAMPVQTMEESSQTAKFDLLVGFSPSGKHVAFEYSTDLFAQATIERMAEHMQTLLIAAVRQPDQRVVDVPVLAQAEQTQILRGWNATAVSHDLTQTTIDLFEAQVDRTPTAIALQFGDTQLSYQELDERANQLAHFLMEKGATIDARVGLCFPRSIHMMIGVLGILKAGSAYVPLDPTYPAERLAYMMENAQTAVLLTQTDLELPAHPMRINLDQTWEQIGQYPRTRPNQPTHGDNLLYVIYTSGSTGWPKGVAMPHRPLVNLIQWQRAQGTLGEPARALQFSSISFDVSCQELFTTWADGGTLVLLDEATHGDARKLVELLDNQAIQRLFLPFVALQQIAEVAEATEIYPHALTHIITAGEQLQSTRHIRNLLAQLPDCCLHNHYGPSESHVCTAYTLPKDSGEWMALPPIGVPVDNTEMYILDEQFAPVPVGVAGMLYIGGVNVTRGYMKRPLLTAERYIPDPHSQIPGRRLYKTGDLARYLPDGNIQFMGRRDFQVKVRGYRIELGELEAIISQHPDVLQAVVTAPTFKQAGAPEEKRVTAYIIPTEPDGNSAELEEKVRQFLQAQVPQYMMPSYMVVLASLPKTPSGKIDRRSLPSPTTSDASSFVGPRDAVEMKLAELWQEILGVSPIGIHDNFFSLGGHSLLAVRLSARIQKELGKEIPIAALFQNSTIAQLAAMIRNEVDLSAISPLVKIRPQGSKTPLFLVHPGGGNVLPYLEVARYLDAERPLYGFQSLGLTAPDQLQTTIRQMATTYLEALREVQPTGPYLLGGWSMGGTVTLEMAHQLLAQGETVEQLLFIDTDAPIPAEESAAIDPILFLLSFAQDIGLTIAELDDLELDDYEEEDEQVAEVMRYLQETGKLPADLSPEYVAHMYNVFRTNYQAMVDYIPDGPIASNITVFKAKDHIDPEYHDETFNWGKWVTGELRTAVLQGNHFSIVREPHLAKLAEELNKVLG